MAGDVQVNYSCEMYFRDITLRDYFAAAALTGLLADSNFNPDDWEIVASKKCYQAADAMLAERERTK